MISYNKLFIFFSISCIISIFIWNILRDVIWAFFLVWFFLLLSINFYSWIRKYSHYISIILLGVICGSCISYVHLQKIDEKSSFIQAYDNTNLYNIELEIQDVYKQDEFEITYKTEILEIDDKAFDIKLNALFKTRLNFSFEKGEVILLNTKIETLKNFNNNFDYVSYLNSKNIFLSLNSYNFENRWKNEITYFEKTVWAVRSEMLQVIKKIYPEDEAVFLGWILIGARENIPDELSSAFNNSWLTHLIAVSGYNITIIIVFLSYVLAVFPKILRIIAITSFIVFYASVVWDSAAVIRASLMWLIWYYVLMSGRIGNSLAIILCTWMIMLIINPFLLNYDIGFQLSFLAVFGLLYTQWFFKKIFFFLPKKFAIQESFVLTLSAFVFTIPIMMFNFGQVSILAPIANMLVAWSIPFAMLFWFLSILAYIINPFFGYVIWFWEYFLLKWTTSIGYLFWGFDFALLQVDLWNYWIYFQIVYFMTALFLVFAFQKDTKQLDVDHFQK